MKDNKTENINDKLFSGFFWKFGERITAQLISLIVSIILARILSPSDYGAVALVLVFITLANVFVTDGLGSSLIQKSNIDNLDFSSVFYINITISIVLYIIIFLTAPIIADFYRISVMKSALRILGLRIIVAAVNSVQQAYVSRHMLFKRFFWSTLFGTLFSGIIGILMALHGFGVWALIFQYLSNTLIDTIVLWFTVRWRPQLKCSWKRVKSLVSYGWKLLASSLLDTGYNQLRSLIIGRIYTAEDLAFYNYGDRYPSLIVININSSISSVLFPAMSQYQNNTERVKQMTRKAIQLSSYVMWPLMLGLGVAAESVIKMLMTEKWLPCVPFLRIFCFTYGLWPIHTANLQALKAIGRTDLFLKLELIKKIFNLAALGVSIQFGPIGIAWSLVIAGISSTFINSFPNRRLLNYNYIEQLKDLLSPLILAMIMAVMIYPVYFLGLSDMITVVFQVIFGSIIYLVLSMIFKNQTFYYLIAVIKNSIQK